MNKQYFSLLQGITVFSCLAPVSLHAQVIPDNTLPENSVVTPQGDVIQINGGTTRGTNLFHSFTDFSVPAGTQANFNNADAIDNILSRVTGGRESLIEGGIGARGTANVFLINPAGIIFGQDAFLNVGGSFIGSTADSLLFSDGIEYSATNLENPPILTINAPIGLGFRDNPGDIVNSSIVTDDLDTPDDVDDVDDVDFIGLRVFEDRTLALIGGEVSIEGGFLSTISGRIELGSVTENSTVSITPVAKGFDFGYEEASGFQDISLSGEAFVNNLDANTGDIELQGRNISLIEGSVIGIKTEFEGQAGDINITASESLTLDGNGSELETNIFSDLSEDATGESSSININTPILNITNGAFISTTNDVGIGEGVDINITASEINLAESFLDANGEPITSGIFTDVLEEGTGNGGDITIITDNLNLNNGAQIATGTFGSGNGGNLTINASKSIKLNGTIPDSTDPSALFANVEIPNFSIPTAGNGGDIAIDTPRLVVRDGAQIGTTAQNDGNGGTLTINASESILLSGVSPSAEFRGLGISGIFVSAESSFEDESGEIIPTTGNGGTLNLTTPELIIEKGATISADTFSLGEGGNAKIDVERLVVRDGSEIRAGSLLGVDSFDEQRGAGGTINIDASDSIEVAGTGDINGTSVNSSISTLAESNSDAGNLILTTNQLTISDEGEINASAIASGGAGTLNISANAIDLTESSITASTNGGDGGNITLDIAENLTLRENSLISARAFGNADGGNINILNSQFIIAFPTPSPGNGNDIIANADRGTGGNITITAESLFGIQEQNARSQNRTNDIDASSARGAQFNGTVTINTPDISTIQGDRNLPTNLIQTDRTTAQACRRDRELAAKNRLTISGKGGILSEPGLPLSSLNLSIDGEINSTSAIPQSIETSQGKIQPARGIKVMKSGEVVLTSYRTNNSGDRLSEIKRNCG